MPEVTGRGIRTKWKTQETTGAGLGELKVGLHAILTRTAPCLAGEVGCVGGQALPCLEGATGPSRRIFSEKKKNLWGTVGNSLAEPAPVSSPPHHLSRDCVHLISEGAETTGTTRGRVPNNKECAYPPPGSARTSSQRELRLQAPPGPGCPATGSVPIHRGVQAPHLGGS